MKTRNPRRRDGFTLLELVVVLSILAVLTTVAMRSVSQIEDTNRYEANQRIMDGLKGAVVGSEDDRAADGSRTVNGFVADMGRLPRTVLETDGTLSLAELWRRPVAPGDDADAYLFRIRPATTENGVPADGVDNQVLVPGGWRGPYVRLPLGASQLTDGWGNAVVNGPSGTYPRLRDALDAALTGPDQEISIIRHLGANGVLNPSDTGLDRDEALTFLAAGYQATISGQVEVMDDDEPAAANPGQQVIVRCYGPDPSDPSKIKVVTSGSISFSANPVTYTLPATTMVTRVIRAHLNGAGRTAASAALRRSTVKHVTLRPGANLVDLEINR